MNLPQWIPISSLHNLQELVIENASIKGPGLEHLNKLEKLRRSKFQDCRLSDSMFQYLPNTKNLTRIEIVNAPITDAALVGLGERTTLVYDTTGRQIETINPLGLITTSVYDDDNRLIASVNPLGERTTFGYDAASNQIRTTNPLGFISTNVYDIENRLVASIDPLGNTSTTIYDTAGLPITQINPLGFATTTVYDDLNRPLATIDPLGQHFHHRLRCRSQ